MGVLKIESVENKIIQEMYDRAMSELKEIFEINWKYNVPSILLIPDRKTYDSFRNKKTEDWEVGLSTGRHIFLLSPDNYEQESSHKYSDEEYYSLLKHELTHAFSHIITRNSNPIWFTEGVAIFLSGQNKTKTPLKEFSTFLNYFQNGGKGVYRESGFAVELLYNKYGKKKLLEILKFMNTYPNEEQFKIKFEEIYPVKLEYDSFNQMLIGSKTK